jgi:hypothetical protein
VSGRLRFAALVRYGVAAAFLAAGLLLILGSQFAARASAPGEPSVQTPQPAVDDIYCDDDADDPVSCFGPAGQMAGLLAADGTIAPDPRDADLGGVAATGVLLMSIGGAVVASSAGGLAGLAGGAVGGAGGTAGGQPAPGGHGSMTPFHAASGSGLGAATSAGATANATALGVVPAVSGINLPVPRADLIQGGLSIFRSMKRVTDQADPRGYSPGDVAQLFGDAAGIAALASMLAPGIGLIALATGGAAAASDVKSPQEIFEQMRRNFGRMGYLQGVIDENVSHADHELGDLDPAAVDPAAVRPPSDPSVLSAENLKIARTFWAGRADAAFDALAHAQQELDDLDDRRSNLAHQIDAVGDLLGRTDVAGTVGLPGHLADTISYGRGWYFAGDSSKMAAALRQSFEQSRATGVRHRRRTAGGPPAASVAVETPPPGELTLAQWAAGQKEADARLAVLQALAGLERWRGFYDALASSVLVELNALRVGADVAVAARRDLASEVQRRALGGKAR